MTKEAAGTMESRGIFQRRDFLLSLVPVVLHLAFVLRMLLRYTISITSDPRRNYWEYFWQLLPSELLQAERFTSLWNLHSQPPLYNLLGAVLMRFGPEGFVLESIHVLNVVMGAALCGLLYFPAQILLRRRWLSVLLCGAVALHPSLLLYEAYILYDVITVFLVVATLACVAFFQWKERLGWLAAFLAGMNLLVLTRTIFHPVVLVPALLLSCIWAGAQWRRILLLGLLLSLPVVGWCAKNYMKFGFWGTTSWTGMNLWRVAAHDYSSEEREELVQAGLMDPMVAVRDDFPWPRELAGYGFNATSAVSALNRDDFNNINIPAVARVYQANAVRLILYSPRRYIRTVGKGAILFCRPSFEFEHLMFNVREIPRYLGLWRALYGRQPRWLVGLKKPEYGFTWMVLHLVALALFAARILQARFVQREPLAIIIRRRPTEFALAFLCLWVFFVGCAFEVGENDRFKFVIEFPAYLFVAAMLTWAFQALSGRVTAICRGSATAPRL